MQGMVLSSFFYGYISTQLFGGWLSARIGGKRVFGLGIATTAFLTIITPPLARINVYILVALRIIEGICEVDNIKISITRINTSFLRNIFI